MLLRCSALTTAHHCFGVGRVAGDYLFRAGDKLFQERIINFLMDVEPARRSANLPAILVLRRHRGGSRGINVRILQNDDRIFSAKFQLQSFYGLTAAAMISFPTSLLPVKATMSTPWCEDNAPPTGRRACYEVDSARRQA